MFYHPLNFILKRQLKDTKKWNKFDLFLKKRQDNMLTYEEIKSKLDAIVSQPINDLDKQTIKVVASQLGYTVPTCNCKDKFSDLLIKLKLWVKNHPDGFCHYQMRPGVVRKGPNGNVYNLNLTDELAEWLIANDPEHTKWLTKIAEYNVIEKSPDLQCDSNKSTVVSNSKTIVENVPQVETVEQPTKKRGRPKKKVENE